MTLDVKHGAGTQMARKRREEDPLWSMSSLVATALDVGVVLSVKLVERQLTLAWHCLSVT